MTATEVKTIGEFVQGLEEAGLLTPDCQVAVRTLEERQPDIDVEELAEYLVANKVLARLQADWVRKGKGGELDVGNYTLVEIRGSGSMGPTFLAVSKATRESFALKLLPKRSPVTIPLVRKAMTTFAQCGARVAGFVDAGSAGSRSYVVWPYVEGRPLELVVRQQGRLPLDKALDYAIKIALGLYACHKHQLFHGLLKPSDILVDEEDNVTVVDYGKGMLLATQDDHSIMDSMTLTSALASNLECSCPEGLLDPTTLSMSSDLYSFGCVLYFCLTGQYPFAGGTNIEKIVAHQKKEPTPLRELRPEVPEELAGVVGQLMAKSPQARMENIQTVIRTLRALSSPRADSRPVPLPPRSPSGRLAVVQAGKTTPAPNAQSSRLRVLTSRVMRHLRSVETTTWLQAVGLFLMIVLGCVFVWRFF